VCHERRKADVVSERGPSMSGPLEFARFAFPPNSLGYCGPPDAEELFGATAVEPDPRALSVLAARFDGAWPYLQLIAACNGIADALDRRVVDAYWIGNALLERVPVQTLVAHLDHRFERRVRQDFEAVAGAAMSGGAPHHNFHVFAVYPWLGLLRAGMDGAPTVVLDRCRVRWGTVVSVEGDWAKVSSRALVLKGHVLAEGPLRLEQVRVGIDGFGLPGRIAAGDKVALHWDWVCARLSPGSLRRLAEWSARMMRAVNVLPAPGPAVSSELRGG
jgi:hypothetical protein